MNNMFTQGTKGLFTWREEDPSTGKILESETTLRLVYMQKFGRGCYQVENERKTKLLAFGS